jgi:DNA-binding CsgD family transcriptional regulator
VTWQALEAYMKNILTPRRKKFCVKMISPTSGQIRYLQMLAGGLTQMQIAFATGRHRVTVARQLQLARLRLGADTIEQAVAIAMSLGLIIVKSVRTCPRCQAHLVVSDIDKCSNCGENL